MNEGKVWKPAGDSVQPFQFWNFCNNVKKEKILRRNKPNYIERIVKLAGKFLLY